MGVTFVTQLTPLVIRHVHSGRADTMNEPLPPPGANGCSDAAVVTAQDAMVGLDDPTNDESHAVASVSRTAPSAPVTARAGRPGRKRGPRRVISSGPGGAAGPAN
jgi:hypothetical protein